MDDNDFIDIDGFCDSSHPASMGMDEGNDAHMNPLAASIPSLILETDNSQAGMDFSWTFSSGEGTGGMEPQANISDLMKESYLSHMEDAALCYSDFASRPVAVPDEESAAEQEGGPRQRGKRRRQFPPEGGGVRKRARKWQNGTPREDRAYGDDDLDDGARDIEGDDEEEEEDDEEEGVRDGKGGPHPQEALRELQEERRREEAEERQRRKKKGQATKKAKVRDRNKGQSMPDRESAVLPSYKQLWTREEEEKMRKGMLQFGRKWRLIANVVGTRSSRQIKNHARPLLRKLEKESPHLYRELCDRGVELRSSGTAVKSEHPTTPSPEVVAAVAARIESAADEEESDEEVDILDIGDDAEPVPVCATPLESLSTALRQARERGETLPDDAPSSNGSSTSSAAVPTEKLPRHVQRMLEPVPPSENVEFLNRLEKMVPESTEEFEIEDNDEISSEEREINREFFIGATNKTPERYIRIRNYILSAWRSRRPEYISKVLIRSGLKDCGDVNAIGRVHAFLDRKGAINFNCSNRPKKRVHVPKLKVLRAPPSWETSSFVSPLFAGARRRKVRASTGEWVFEDVLSDYESGVVKHKEANRHRTIVHGAPKRQRPRAKRSPFELIRCNAFGEEAAPGAAKLEQPYAVAVHPAAMVLMDVHAHVSSTEIIGLLAGTFDEAARKMTVRLAIPCDSNSTGTQCEMDPVSETNARTVVADMQLEVVGWYHSHPTFEPDPSLRDIENQKNYQTLFATPGGAEPFLGVIVSPYDPTRGHCRSKFRFVHISNQWSASCNHRLPYELRVEHQERVTWDWGRLYNEIQQVVDQYSMYIHRVELLRSFHFDNDQSCSRVDKLIRSISRFLSQECEAEDGRRAVVKQEDEKSPAVFVEWLHSYISTRFQQDTETPPSDDEEDDQPKEEASAAEDKK